uniref:Type II secretion system protein GspN n=1 Tax=uncultured marine bacterium MedDCM-OCT-S01-C143 TaxID=743046 RepID=D6PCD0_9BACT|nr:hypothetical protein [uncultured marine bacterium MedDCM-OCT-S01-C143]
MRKERVLRFVGYAVFSLFSLFIALYLTFPIAAVAERLSFDLENRSKGALTLEIGDIDLAGITGVEAEEVRVGLGFTDPAIPLKIDELRVRFGLLALLLTNTDIQADAMVGAGKVEGVFRSEDKFAMSLGASWQNLDLNAPPILPSLAGVPLAGELSGQVELAWTRSLSKANGMLSFGFDDIELGAGEVFPGFKIGSPVGSGKISMGYEVKDGTALLSQYEQTSDGKGGQPALSLELVEARAKLNNDIRRTTFEACVKFKLEDAYLNKKENKDLKRAIDLLNLQFRKDPEGYFHAAFSGDFSFVRKLRLRKRLCKKTKK